MGMVRSTFYDRLQRVADNTAIVEARFAICDEFEVLRLPPRGLALTGLRRESQEDQAVDARNMICRQDSQTLRRRDRERSRRPDLPEPGKASRSEQPQRALGLRHHLCRAAGSRRPSPLFSMRGRA